jgi:5'-methylthioadenosine phosphorylase
VAGPERLGVIGGSGFYRLVDDVEHVRVDTPYGATSGPIALGEVEGRAVAFVARHGSDHELPPHRVNYRANLWALHALGARRVLGPCAAGSLQPSIHPGDFVVCDQLVDRTSGRAATFFDGPETNHLAFADPYCPELRSALSHAGRSCAVSVVEAGTVVVVQGPRFSTRAESRWHRAQGWDVVNMTQSPEAPLARELGLCYATVALVTDYDTGVEDAAAADPTVLSSLKGTSCRPATKERGEAVSQEAVFAFFQENLGRLRDVLFAAIAAIPTQPGAACGCAASGRAVP